MLQMALIFVIRIILMLKIFRETIHQHRIRSFFIFFRENVSMHNVFNATFVGIIFFRENVLPFVTSK